MSRRTLVLKDPEPLAARGRNGWFEPTSVDLISTTAASDTRGLVRLSVNSRRAAGIEPIILVLSPHDAAALGTELVSAAEDAHALAQSRGRVIPIGYAPSTSGKTCTEAQFAETDDDARTAPIV